MAQLPNDILDDIRARIQLEEYIKSRRNEETKNYANIFIRFFIEHGTDWIRAKDIYSSLVGPANIAYTSQVTRLLSELTDIGILERREDARVKGTRGSPPVYYRLPFQVTGEFLLSREELEMKILHLEQELDIAKEIIKEFGIEEPGDEIEKRIRDIEES